MRVIIKPEFTIQINGIYCMDACRFMDCSGRCLLFDINLQSTNKNRRKRCPKCLKQNGEIK